MIHLLSNGHSRCGTPAGRLSFQDWPPETGITSTPAVATCPECLAGVSLPPVPVSPVIAHVVEVTKKGIAEMTGEAKVGMDCVTAALMAGTTMGELTAILQKAIPIRPRSPVEPGEA